jgi:alpha-L-fucosidase
VAAQNVLAVLALVSLLVMPGTLPQLVIRDAGRLSPSPQQLAWQHEELTAFIHFGPNTFTDREWGTGKERPNFFDPSSMNTDQWVRALKDAGFKKVILVAKHHDGFVLWPTRYTLHSVKSSRWMGGRGDVVASFVRSAHKYGLLVGFYLSPADLYQAQPGGVFANHSAARPVTIPTLVKGDTRRPTRFFHFVLDDYNAYYLNELYELLTQYGPVEEVWFDGANPLAGSGRVQPYDFHDWYAMVRALQPSAVIFPIDLNWVGNERGYARLSQWSVVPLTAPPVADQSTHVVDVTSDALGSDATLTNPRTRLLRWMPAECDVPLERGWFWHPDSPPKTLAQLQAIYYASAGRNCQLLLDVPPDRRGLFDTADVARLHEFGAWVRSTFAADLAAGAAERTSRDGMDATFTFDLPRTATFATIELRERIEDGQRIARFVVDARNASTSWRQVAEGTTIGYKRLLRLPAATRAHAIRVRVLAARDKPMLTGISLYR